MDSCRTGGTTRNTEAKDWEWSRGAGGPLTRINQGHSQGKQKYKHDPKRHHPYHDVLPFIEKGRSLRYVQQHFSFGYNFFILPNERGGLDHNEDEPQSVGSQNNRPPDTELSLQQ